MSIKVVSNEKIAETTSKGNQEKWRENGYWYKLDKLGYEALAETFTSLLLGYSNIETETPFTFVQYRMERISAHGRERTCCCSKDFLQQQGEAIITLDRLFSQYKGRSLKAILKELPSDKQRLRYLAEQTAELTGLAEFPKYLTLLFEVDALVLNEDRHLNNIAVLRRGDKFDYCPIFDQGAGLLSDVGEYPMDVEPKALIPLVRARPLRTTFNRQIGAMHKLYGSQLKMPKFTNQQLRELIEPLLQYYSQRDQGYIADRVCAVVMARQKVCEKQ